MKFEFVECYYPVTLKNDHKFANQNNFFKKYR